jgi:hypothetical protein
MVVAPAAVTVAGLSITVATPVESVSAVAAGEIVAKLESVLNATTAPETAAPLASFNAALTVAGVLLLIEDTGTPPLVSERVRLGAVLTAVSAVPAPQPESIAIAAANKNGNERLDFLNGKWSCT